MLRLHFLPLVCLPALVFAAVPPTAATQLAFVRGAELPDKTTALQTLSAEYRPADGRGPSIWLVGVAHLGTPDYYSALQKRLDAQSSVLFEGVGGDHLAAGAKADTSAGIQGRMARALGLQFQLDAIDYRRSHFKNSDLTPEALNAAVERRASRPGGPEPDPAAPPVKSKEGQLSLPTAPKVDNATFSSLMDALHGEGEMAEALGGLVGLIGSSPEMRETTKVMLIEALGQAGELLDLAKAASPDMKDLLEVLITERNATVVRQLDEQIKALGPDKSVAVFYGAAHMDEIAARLTGTLGYRLAGQHLDTAFTADPTRSILPAEQMKNMLQMMRNSLNQPGAGSVESPFPLLNLFSQPPSPAPRQP